MELIKKNKKMKKNTAILVTTILLTSLYACNNDETSKTFSTQDYENNVAKSIDDTSDSELFLRKNAFIIGPRLSNDNGLSARTVYLASYSEKVETSLYINDVEYVDNGEGNDEIAGDKIYTSMEVFKDIDYTYDGELNVIYNEDFFDIEKLKKDLKDPNSKFLKELEKYGMESKGGIGGTVKKMYKWVKDHVTIKGGCKVRHTKEGNSILGFPCNKNGGCIEIYDCKFDVEFK